MREEPEQDQPEAGPPAPAAAATPADIASVHASALNAGMAGLAKRP